MGDRRVWHNKIIWHIASLFLLGLKEQMSLKLDEYTTLDFIQLNGFLNMFSVY